MSLYATNTIYMTLDFLQVHSLAHKFQYGGFSSDERVCFAVNALSIMKRYNAIHPHTLAFIAYLKSTGNPAASEYTEGWMLQVKASASIPQYLSEEDYNGTPPKAAVFQEFVTLCQQKFIEGDFRMISYYITRIAALVPFSTHSIGAEQFILNKYFEFLFYQVISVVHGLLWGHSCSQASTPGQEMTTEQKLSQTDKKVAYYYGRSTYLLKSLSECTVDVADGVNAEFAYYNLCKWYLAMSRFSQNQFIAFVADFEHLYPQFESICELNMQSEVLSMYAIASVACKPFKELTYSSNESLFERFTCGSGVEMQLHSVMFRLAQAEFSQARSALNNGFYRNMNASLAYLLPKKSEGFWTYWSDVVDLKIFLLFISVTQKVPRRLVVKKLGYTDCTPAEYTRVCDNLVVLMSVLLLGSVGITYDEKEDAFVRENTDSKFLERVMQHLDQVNHTGRADAAAQLLRGMLVEKYF